jgi:hypothetical protein
MTQAPERPAAAADPAPALPFAVQSWSRDPSAATPSELTGRKLLFIVLGLAAGSVALLAGALVTTAFLVVRVAEAILRLA